ncbi:trypsin-like peptidase domain-containing protein [Nocardioides sp. SLBN-35]|uniref:trypsin-like peptidase domain-containing protein n=1 Tax=Nocardioides sp. SLBN-35 TaxID=2768445 RepID=UPI00116D951B|nr:trypsin-like peptidase domain-containing protein [Nocardioides sp. SLBN-35]TQK70239.1 putative serine protease PepD [Nocardioides sp. SLBN-35]
MSALVVEVDGRVLRLEGKPVYRIGRAIEADVVLTAGSVSRQHAELQATDYGWVLVDSGSQFGTYVDDERITDYPVERRITVRCGPPAPGSSLAIIPAEEYDVVAATPVAPAPPPDEPSGPAAPSYVVDEATRPPFPVTPPPSMPPSMPPSTPPSMPPPATPPMGTPSPWAPPAGAPVPSIPAPGARPAAAPGLPAAISGNDATQILAMPRPSGPPGAGAAPRTGPDLLLVAEGREHRFRHPTPITVGRRSDCTVVIGDPACSRLHGRIDPVPGGWTYTNLSNEGTFHDGRRVTTTRFDERLALRLGHPVAGPELTLVPILSAAEEERRIARRRLGKRLAIIGGIAAALLLVAGIVGLAFVLGRDEPVKRAGGDTDVLEAAKAATVKITAESHLLDDPSKTGTYHGSGSIIRSDGLILTNAHVAAPESPGLAEKYGDEVLIANPNYLLISLTDGMTDTNAPAAYRARVVEADGNLDVAVVQIYADEDGKPLEDDLDLPTVPIGSSDDLRAGDSVTVLGFPAVAGDGESITVTTGVISTVLNDPDLGPRSELDTDARIAPGNSGGMAINEDGELIGIPTSLFADEGSTVTSGRIRSIDVVKDLIKKAEDETD